MLLQPKDAQADVYVKKIDYKFGKNIIYLTNLKYWVELWRCRHFGHDLPQPYYVESVPKEKTQQPTGNSQKKIFTVKTPIEMPLERATSYIESSPNRKHPRNFSTHDPLF